MSTTIERTMPVASVNATSYRALTIAGWTTTGIFAAIMTVSGVSFLVGPPPIVGMLAHLGYPAYLRPLLGAPKLLGVTALLMPSLGPVREWSYAGFAVLFAGAVASHLLAGDGVSHALPAAFVGGLLLVSRWLRRRAQPPVVARG
jgi:hypothetical protein